MESFILSIATNSHVLCAAAGAFATWGVMRWSTFMGWYATHEAAISKATGANLPAALPTTVAELKAAAPVLPTAAPTAVTELKATATSLVTDAEKAAGDAVADVKAKL